MGNLTRPDYRLVSWLTGIVDDEVEPIKVVSKLSRLSYGECKEELCGSLVYEGFSDLTGRGVSLSTVWAVS